MPLYDVTKRPVKVSTKDAENFEVLVKLKKKLPEATFNKLVRTVDQAIDSVKPSESSKLVWTRSSALFGHGSSQPHKSIEHLWEKVESIFGQDKYSLIAVGGLLRWRISIRKENWLVYRRDSDTLDPITGKLITISEYWINESFTLTPKENPQPKVIVRKANVNDLASKWGARLA